MIKLIYNELIKIIRKKSFIIMILVMVGFGVITNLLYNSIDSIIDYSLEVTEEDYEIYDKNDKDDLPFYVNAKANYEFQRFQNKYDRDSWQYGYLKINREEISDIFYNIESYENKLTNSNEIYEMAKEEYELLKAKLENKDWKDIVKEEIASLEEAILETTDKTDKRTLEIKIEVLNRRLSENISFENYFNDSLLRYETAKITLLGYENIDISKLDIEEKTFYYDTRESYLSNEYILENKIKGMDDFNSNSTIFQHLFEEYTFVILIMIFMVSGSITSQEFSKGTIKLLLLKPYSRIKILLSKYIAVLINTLFSILLIYLIQLVVGSIILGSDTLNNPVLVYNCVSDSLKIYNLFDYSLLTILANLPQLIILGTLTFAASTIFNNTALAVVLGLGGFMSANIILSLISGLKKWWVKYLICFNWDFTPYIFGKAPLCEGLNFTTSFMICLITLIIMLVPTFIIFKKKDISNV